MKTAIIVAFACCFALVVGKECKNDKDCLEGECCAKLSVFVRPKCKKLGIKGQLCTGEGAEWTKDSDIHRTWCPCIEGLVCQRERVNTKSGYILDDPRCARPKSTIF